MHRSYDGDIADERWKRAIGLAKRAVEAGCDLSEIPYVEEEEEQKSTWLGSPNPLSQGVTLAQQLSAAAAASSPSVPTSSGPPGLFPPKKMLRPSNVVRKKYLVLLDMNGTLLVRTKQRLPRPHSAILHDIYYYFREDAMEFVEELASNPFVTLAFYTSMKASSAKPAVTALCRGASAELYPREFNKDDPRGSHSWDTMRDLEKIWATTGRAGCGFDETNTIVVEDTVRKMREHPHNVVVVPTYTEISVVRNKDDALRQLSRYFKTLFESQTSDVRTYLQAKPFACVVEEDDDDDISALLPKSFKPLTPYHSASKSTTSSGKKANRSPKPSPHQRRDYPQRQQKPEANSAFHVNNARTN